MHGERSRTHGDHPWRRACAAIGRALVLGCALAAAGCAAEDAASVTAALRADGGPRGNAYGRSKDAGPDASDGTELDGSIADAGDDGGSDSSADAGTELDAGTPPSGDAGTGCVRARRMWFDDFETGDYSRWTGGHYDADWGNACQSNAISTIHPLSGIYDQRNEIVCRMRGRNTNHHGYGGLQFSGDTVLPEYTNTGSGMDAPHGIVTTFWSWLEAGYSFGNGRWVSLFSVFSTCNYTEPPMTLGIDQPDGILRAAHWWPEGASRIEPSAPAMPYGRWVRITVYVNLGSGEMHTWQDGEPVEHVTGIVRASHLYCQWHWGLYASGDNTDVVLFEDDKSIWKLEQPWTDFTREPWLAETQPVCDG